MKKNKSHTISEFEIYEHHGRDVWVRSSLKGKHKEMCLCYSCMAFHPGEKTNCPMAKENFEFCKKYCMVTPVFECRKFVPEVNYG
jgi:hypothetical protein